MDDTLIKHSDILNKMKKNLSVDPPISEAIEGTDDISKSNSVPPE